jgi:hypothetical protein
MLMLECAGSGSFAPPRSNGVARLAAGVMARRNRLFMAGLRTQPEEETSRKRRPWLLANSDRPPQVGISASCCNQDQQSEDSTPRSEQTITMNERVVPTFMRALVSSFEFS